MAIEFNCPYCTASIRVPDAYAGKQGRCPKCDTRLLVPAVARPDQPGTTVAGTGAQSVPAGQVAPSLTDGETDVFLVKPVAPTMGKRRPVRRRPSRALVIGIPVLGFLVLMGLIFYSLTSGFPKLTGELVARRSDEKSLPRVTIGWSETGCTEEEQARLREFLSKTPEILASQVMTCRLIGTPEGIEVLLTAGQESDWFAVDVSGQKTLALWIRNERSKLNVRRNQLLRKALAEYVREKLAQIAGEPTQINAMNVRDNIAINACTNALGSVLETTTGQLRVPCVFEDAKGTLYFCLPAGTLAFEITGRGSDENGLLFPGEFTAVVAPDVVVQDETATEPGDEKAGEAAEEMESEEPTPETSSEAGMMGEGGGMKGE